MTKRLARVSLLATLAACTVGKHHPDAATDAANGYADPCTAASMNATLGAACAGDGECQDGCFCNGAELCGSDHTCRAGMEPCGDGIDCTFDACVEPADSCVHDPRDEACADGDACNGIERCSPLAGCLPPITSLDCGDQDLCTWDSCERSSGCVHAPLDLDMDGEGSLGCGGLDCNDEDAAVSSHASEICDNWIDDDCDGLVDTQDTACPPTYGTCETALRLPGPGVFPGATFGLSASYPLACRTERSSGAEAVFLLTLDQVRDVVVSVRGNDAAVAMREATSCATGPEIGCVAALRRSPAVRARSLPAGDYAILVHTLSQDPFELSVTYLDPTAVVVGDTCATAIALADTASVAEDGLFEDSRTSCASSTSPLWTDAYFYFDLATPQAVSLTATQAGATHMSIDVTSACGDLATEGGCGSGPSPLARSFGTLAAGRYYVTVATQLRGGTIDLALVTSPPP